MRKDLMKTMSYAVVHFTVAFSVVYLLTGSVPIATGVAMLEPLVNTVAYFFHERAWSFFSRRSLAHSSKRHVPEQMGQAGASA